MEGFTEHDEKELNWLLSLQSNHNRFMSQMEYDRLRFLQHKKFNPPTKVDFKRYIRYINGASLRLPNKRVTVLRLEEGAIGIDFTKVTNTPDIKGSYHINLRNKAMVTGVKLTREVALGLFLLLGTELGIMDPDELLKTKKP